MKYLLISSPKGAELVNAVFEKHQPEVGQDKRCGKYL
jgi:hypothetical protein